MGYFPVRYDSRVVNYNRRGFIRLASGIKQTSRTSLKGHHTSSLKREKHLEMQFLHCRDMIIQQTRPPDALEIDLSNKDFF